MTRTLPPPRTEEPRDAAAAAALLRTCADAGEAVVIEGGATKGGGNPPSRHDVTLRTKHLHGVIAYDPHDLTIAVGAGTTIAALTAALRRNRQMLPFDVPRAARATVGGTLAAAWAGPRRLAYGRPRDLLIGMEFALADGTVGHSGGMVVKNVTGYDLGKLFVGSRGTLGAITRANFKVLPLPAAARLAIAPLDDDVRVRAIVHALEVDIEPTALLVLSGDAPAGSRLYAFFEGGEATVERAVRDLRSALGAAGVPETRVAADDAARDELQRVVDASVDPLTDTELVLRLTGLPSDVLAREADVRRIAGARPCAIAADLLGGDLTVAFGPAAADSRSLAECIAELRAAQGPARVIAAAPSARAIDAYGSAPETLDVMRGLKERFDPQRVLAPGSFVGGI